MDFSLNTVTPKPSFRSRNFPVKSFKIATEKGELLVNELRIDANLTSSQRGELADFFNGNLFTDNPVYVKMVKLMNRRSLKKDIKMLINRDKGNSTILVARDEKNKIKAAIMTDEFHCINGCEDTKTCLLDAFAVSLEYRKHKVGKVIFDKCMESVQNIYTDIFIFAKNSAVPFYGKQGFETLETGVKTHKKVVNLIRKSQIEGSDEYVTQMHKSVGSNIDSWCTRILSNN